MPNNTMLTAETITTAQIKALMTEQSEAGDYAQEWLCLRATAAHKPAGHGGHGDRAVVLSGWKALEYARAYAGAPGLVISKYAGFKTEFAKNAAEVKKVRRPAGRGGKSRAAAVPEDDWLSGMLSEAAGTASAFYADPTEGARTGLTLAEATEIAKEDPGLIWIEDGITDADRMEAREACADAINAGQG